MPAARTPRAEHDDEVSIHAERRDGLPRFFISDSERFAQARVAVGTWVVPAKEIAHELVCPAHLEEALLVVQGARVEHDELGTIRSIRNNAGIVGRGDSCTLLQRPE